MDKQNSGALSDVVVLDLSRVVAGPISTCLLADMGAEVIKIENPHDGGDHYTRASAPFVDGISVWYATLNRNKKCITLNLKSEQGRQMFFDLVKKADVVTENFRPGVMDRLEIGYEELKKANPRIVLASISGYGSCGPYCERPGYDVVAQGMGGIMSVTGFPGNPPTRVGVMLGDLTAGMNLTIGILAALHRARITGQGQKLEVALVDSIFSMCAREFASYAATGIVPGLSGNRDGLWCPYGTYSAKDGNYQLGIGTDAQFRVLCDVMEQPNLARDPRYETHEKRKENEDDLENTINAWGQNFTVRQMVDKLNAVGIPSCPVYDMAAIDRDPHFYARDMIKTMQLNEQSQMRYVNMPIRFSETPIVAPTAPGELGQCNEEVYSRFLGLDKDSINKLHEDGVI